MNEIKEIKRMRLDIEKCVLETILPKLVWGSIEFDTLGFKYNKKLLFDYSEEDGLLSYDSLYLEKLCTKILKIDKRDKYKHVLSDDIDITINNFFIEKLNIIPTQIIGIE